MALEIDLSDHNDLGIPIPRGYVRFRKNAEYVSMAAKKATFRIEAFFDQASADAGKQPLNFVGFVMPEVEVSFDPASDTANDIVTRAYEFVKSDADTYPELVGATDV